MSLLFLGAAHVDAESYLGVALPVGSKTIGPHRFQSSRSYEDTKREYHDRFLKSKHIKRIGDEINLPHVRATLYKNLDKKAGFYGINIYLNAQTGLTEIFYLVK